MANTFLEELGPYSSMIVPETGSAIGSLVYANTQDLTSTALVAVTGGIIPANQQLQFYLAGLGEIGGGYTTGATLGQTNSLFSKGQAAKNQVYVATHIGFELFITGTTDPSVAMGESLASIDQVFSFGTNFSWDLTIGRGNVRTIGTLLDYPGNSGAWASVGDDPSSTGSFPVGAQNGTPGMITRKLATPICFPPLVNVTLTASNGNAFTILAGAGSAYFGVRAILKGALMTAPQG